MATGYLDALAAGDEYYTPEDDMASAPSSYRRLRRSRSMLPEFQAARKSQEGSGRFLASSSLKSRPLASSTSRRFFRSDPNDRKSAHEAPILRAPKSMSFLSSRKSQSRSGTGGDGGVQELRHSGLPDLPEDGSSDDERRTPRPRYKASMLFSSRNRHSDLSLTMRKSLRGSGSGTGSTDDAGEPSGNSQRDAQEPRTLRLKARQASRSLRGKLKSLFTMTKPDEETPSMPYQHIEAQRTHVTQLSTSTSDGEAPVTGDGESMHSPLARTATLRLVPPGLAQSREASLESLRSGQDRNISDGSSLTSWAHSGPSTLTSQEQQQWKEWERQRLSVIGEHGAHAPSPSIPRRALGPGLFQAPESNAEIPAAPRPVVDSQRIYSALVKRVRGTNALTTQAGEDQPPALEADQSTLANTPDTIRRVVPEWKYSRQSDEMATPTRPSRRMSVPPGRDSCNGQPTHHPAATPRAHHGYQSRRSDVLSHERPASIATIATSPRKSADWRPSATDSLNPHLFRAASPYRRALRKTMQEEQDAWAQQRPAGSDAGTQIHHHGIDPPESSTDSDSAKNLDYSESVYSSSDYDGGDGGRDPRAQDTPAAYRNHAIVNREASAASSINWKTWLSANVGKLEPSPSSPASPDRPSDPYPQRTQSWIQNRRHVRERAQTHWSECDGPGLDWDDEEEEEEAEETDVEGFGRSTPTAVPPMRVPPPPPPPLPPSALLHPAVLGQVQPNVPKRSPLRGVSSVATRDNGTVSRGGSGGVGAGFGGCDETHDKNGTWNRERGIGERRVLTKMLGEENESPCGLSLSLSGGVLPPPIPARSKLRPEPLRIERGVVGSPGLTEAVRRQFGGGVGNGGGGGEAGGAFL